MSRLRLITLDMKDCVIRMKRPPILDYIEVARRHGLDEKHLNTDTVGKNFMETYRQMNKVHPHFGSLSHVDSKEWWKKIVHGAFKGEFASAYCSTSSSVLEFKSVLLPFSDAYSKNPHQVEQIATELYDFYSSSESWEIYNDAVMFLKALKESHCGIKTGMITNFDRRILGLLEQFGISHLIDVKVFAEQARKSKPDPNIFLQAAFSSKIEALRPDECLHIGDSVDTDYLGAIGAGWNAKVIHRTSSDDISASKNVDPKHVFTGFCSIYYDILPSI